MCEAQQLWLNGETTSYWIRIVRHVHCNVLLTTHSGTFYILMECYNDNFNSRGQYGDNEIRIISRFIRELRTLAVFTQVWKEPLSDQNLTRVAQS